MASSNGGKSDFNVFLRNKILILIIGIPLVTALLVFLALSFLNIYTNHGEYVLVPDVKGMQIEAGMNTLIDAGLNCEVVDSLYMDDAEPGSIVDVTPEAGTNVKENRTIYLKMQAKHPQLIVVPNMQDYSLRQARSILSSLKFENVRIEEKPSVYKGLVLYLKDKYGNILDDNAKLTKKDEITIVVGAGGEVLIDSIIDYIPDSLYDEPIEPTDMEPSLEPNYFD